MVAYADVVDAAQRLKGVAHRTPVMRSDTLDRRTGASLFLKCENLQRMGAFKFRGAFNALSRIPEEARRRGVVAYSSGNHAQAVALAGGLLGVQTTIVMPDDAPAAKTEATRGYGARVVSYDRATEQREEIAEAIRAETGGTLIPPFDNEDVIAGAATAALELFEDAAPLDALFVPCGGGGLLSGSAIVAREMAPGCRVIGVEPALADDATRSFKTGVLQSVHHPMTIADGARTASLGRFTFPLVRALVDDMVTVSEAEILDATRFLWERMKLVVEPTGALGLAGSLKGLPGAAKRVGIILSGGNVDLVSGLAALTSSPAELSSRT
jgi:threonine dehydratase